MRRSVWFLALVLALTNVISAQLKVFDKAPDLRPERLLNTKYKTFADFLKGRVIIYVWFSAKEPSCTECITHLHSILQKYGRQGLGAVILTKDGPAEAQKLIDTYHLLPAVALETGLKSYDLYGFATFPTASVVGPDGRISWIGHPKSITRDEIEKYLRMVRSLTPIDQPLKLKLKLQKPYVAMATDSAAGKIGLALKAIEAKKAESGISEIDEAILEEARVAIEEFQAFEEGCAEREEDQHRNKDAFKLWSRLAQAFEGHPCATKYAERAADLEKKLNGG